MSVNIKRYARLCSLAMRIGRVATDLVNLMHSSLCLLTRLIVGYLYTG